METKIEIEAFPKRFKSVMRVLFFMLKKGVFKRKLLLHLINLLLKRGKVAGKAIGDLTFQHQSAAKATADLINFYEFSCNNTPAHHKFLFKKKESKADHYEPQYESIEEEFMMRLNDVVTAPSSPALPGLLGSKQIRIMDSPFPVLCSGRVDEGDRHVDEAADEFIMRFYNELKRQSH